MTSDNSPLLTILEESQNGQLVQSLATACDLEEAQCREALERLVPEIARRISDHIEDDDDLEELVDILDEQEQAAILDDPNAMFSRDVVQDGKDLLELLYGSLDRAEDRAEDIGPPRGVDEDLFERMMTMTAALTFAAMSRRNPDTSTRYCRRNAQGPCTRGPRFLCDDHIGTDRRLHAGCATIDNPAAAAQTIAS